MDTMLNAMCCLLQMREEELTILKSAVKICVDAVGFCLRPA